jgi:hypothetical protein
MNIPGHGDCFFAAIGAHIDKSKKSFVKVVIKVFGGARNNTRCSKDCSVRQMRGKGKN